MASVSSWSANEKENLFLDELNLSNEQGLYIAKIMAAVKANASSTASDISDLGTSVSGLSDALTALTARVKALEDAAAESSSGSGGEDTPAGGSSGGDDTPAGGSSGEGGE